MNPLGSWPERPSLAFVHTVLTLAPTFSQLARELSPEAEVFHIADESLLTVTRRTGALTPLTKRRVFGHIMSAVDGGADLVMVTCSSIGPAVDMTRGFVPVPVLRVDAPMAEEAVRLGQSIGVLATLSSTLEPTAELVERQGRAAGKLVRVVPHLCAGAFDALAAGDRSSHDELVRDGLRRLCQEVDVVVLAQASMARVVDAAADEVGRVPVLSSPRLAMTRVADLLAGRTPTVAEG